jgi:EF-P beta-lysylation protein EpmB
MGKIAILTSADRSVRPVLPAGEPHWQAEIRAAIRSAAQLCERLQLPADLLPQAAAGESDFPVFVPPSYLARIEPGNPHDPLLRQVLPLANEGEVVPGFSQDPVGDMSAKLRAGVLQKYTGRALLVTTGACAVHCRYCFRRHFPYEEVPHSDAAWDAALAAISADPTISEIILSGGDPLMLVDTRLAFLANKIAAIPHVARLRVHTRLPIVVPSRVTAALIAWLTQTRLAPVVVVHANHARELSNDVAVAAERLRHAGVMLLNQAVLLRGVNDSVAAQQELAERLIEVGMLPYYLHQLDRVAGAAHYEVPVEEGRQIIAKLRSRLPGYMVPRYVQEISGEPNKTILL